MSAHVQCSCINSWYMHLFFFWNFSTHLFELDDVWMLHLAQRLNFFESHAFIPAKNSITIGKCRDLTVLVRVQKKLCSACFLTGFGESERLHGGTMVHDFDRGLLSGPGRDLQVESDDVKPLQLTMSSISSSYALQPQFLHSACFEL
jgi:hypothetical protein